MATFKRDLEIEAGELISAGGKRFNYLKGFAPIIVEINGKRNTLNSGMGLIFPEGFTEVYLESTATQAGAEFFIGSEEIVDNRTDVGAAGVVDPTVYNIAYNATPIIRRVAAIPNQRGIFIQARKSNSAGKSIMFTNAAGDEGGMVLEAGEVIYLPVSCDIYLKRADDLTTPYGFSVLQLGG